MIKFNQKLTICNQITQKRRWSGEVENEEPKYLSIDNHPKSKKLIMILSIKL
jgi:hypothetical protein